MNPMNAKPGVCKCNAAGCTCTCCKGGSHKKNMGGCSCCKGGMHKERDCDCMKGACKPHMNEKNCGSCAQK